MRTLPEACNGWHCQFAKIAWSLLVILLLAPRNSYSAKPTGPRNSDSIAVLLGHYYCQCTVLPQPQRSAEILHAVTFSGTGTLTPIKADEGMPFGGNLGTMVTMEGGSLEDCRRFGTAIVSAARQMNCDSSPLSPTGRGEMGVGFSFVCEGTKEYAVHAVGELSRAVVNQRLELPK